MRVLKPEELIAVAGAGKKSGRYGKPEEHHKSKKQGNNGFGNGGCDGVPGNSGKTGEDKRRDKIR